MTLSSVDALRHLLLTYVQCPKTSSRALGLPGRILVCGDGLLSTLLCPFHRNTMKTAPTLTSTPPAAERRVTLREHPVRPHIILVPPGWHSQVATTYSVACPIHKLCYNVVRQHLVLLGQTLSARRNPRRQHALTGRAPTSGLWDIVKLLTTASPVTTLLPIVQLPVSAKCHTLMPVCLTTVRGLRGLREISRL